MKIIVTGGSGFVGKPTIAALREKGYEVFNYDILEGYNLLNLEQLKGVIHPGDKVLHLAAIARFTDADADPLLAYETNVKGTENVALACAAKGAERLVYSSTGSIYMPITKEPPITEEFQGKGNSVYGCSKYVAELIVQREKTPYIILRYAHLYGEGKIGHGAIGGFIARMDRGLAPVLYGGQQSNDFTYILDVVQANLLALESPHLNEVYNIGTGEELTTERVFEILRDLFGYNKEFEKLPMRTVDPLRFAFDISKAKEKLGFNPEYNFKAGMAHYLRTTNEKSKAIGDANVR